MKYRNPFYYLHKNNTVEVWLGVPNQEGSEYVLCIHQQYIPHLISTLRKSNGGGK